MRTSADEQGQTTVLVVGLALLTFAVTGLAIDGTRAFLWRRTLQTAADGSALAGAAELDSAAYYGSGGRHVALDVDDARAMSAAWLARRGIDQAIIEAGPDGVRVVLRGRLDTTFLGLVGISSIPVGVEARAEPLAGSP